MDRPYELRRLSFEDAMHETPLLQLPVVFKGDNQQCQAFAAQLGFRWLDVARLLFGGYWANDCGDCLMPT